MTRLEIDIVNKTIKFKDGVVAGNISRMLGDILIGWESYLILPCDTTPQLPYYIPQPYYFGTPSQEITCNVPYTTFDGPTKM